MLQNTLTITTITTIEPDHVYLLVDLQNEELPLTVCDTWKEMRDFIYENFFKHTANKSKFYMDFNTRYIKMGVTIHKRYKVVKVEL